VVDRQLWPPPGDLWAFFVNQHDARRIFREAEELIVIVNCIVVDSFGIGRNLVVSTDLESMRSNCSHSNNGANFDPVAISF
jgi:hypothetical protein